MNDLVLKLKESLVNHLLSCQDLDSVYVVSRQNGSYTKRQLANEIQNETEFGLKVMTNCLILAIEINNKDGKIE